jgi:hypothetical protein
MVYASGMWPIGSISRVYENLGVIAGPYPVAGNKEGSYMTIWSLNGLIFGIINVSSCRAAACLQALDDVRLGCGGREASAHASDARSPVVQHA